MLASSAPSLHRFISDKSTVFLKKEFHNRIFNNIFERFKTYNNASKFLELNKATLSSWKVRKNRIPLYFLKNICNILNISQEEIYTNVEETDREIAEII